ncbi:hypothetical protein [Neolewinella antarctica]|uniref:Uncharacterized protein n=1 Tax=Neolewinella antarctica TaxID=442734 RepID=A0ABX0X7Z1_9BACT|nr:hypothetical protein [Neolewinella antarctica]NJC25359.1 hypothetical protein [Neolewinella antarctica]
MRNRIAVWGRDAQEKRVLLAIELQVKDNIVRIETYPEKVVSDDIYKLFMDKWRKEQEAELPEPDRVIARELSVTEGLLPEDLKAEQTDMIVRAQTEWHFHVLSAKLAETYKSELAEIEDRVERATEYSSDLWNQAKKFWQKVQGQLQDKTLLREQGNDIRKRVDGTFDTLKKMRDQLNEKYKEESVEQVAAFSAILDKAEASIEQGTHLNRVFNELRETQRKFHNVKFTKQDRDAIYSRIDKAFKAVKEKRGQGKESGGAAGRISSRLEGLVKAMDRMKSGIGRDKEDLKFEHRRIERTDGQLERQIRQAKVLMIESRITSKQAKVDDMEKTKASLEKKVEQEERKAERRAKKDAERAAANAAKAKIAAEIGSREVTPEEAAKLQAAADAISGGKKKKGGRNKATDRPSKQVRNFIAFSEIITPDVPVTKAAIGAPTAEVTTPRDQSAEAPKPTVSKQAIENKVTRVENEGADGAPYVEQAVGDASTATSEHPAPAPSANGDTGQTIAEKTGDAIAGAITSAGEAIAPLREEGGLLDQADDLMNSVVDEVTDAVEDVTDTAKAIIQVASERLAGEDDTNEESSEDFTDRTSDKN